MAKNDWILWVVGGVAVLGVAVYHILIPAQDRAQLFMKFTNPTKWNQFKMECRRECKTTDLSCVAPCMEDAVMTGYTTHKKVPWGGGTQQTPAGTRYLAGPNDLPPVE